MKHCVVIGAGFGDEGKGMVVDYLCSQNQRPIVIRFCGGHQAGHTVFRGGVRHMFSTFGSGTLQGVSTYWSKYCTVDPIAIMNEYYILRAKGVSPILFIDPECPITTPYDMCANILDNKKTGHGSCQVGVGTTLQREEDHYSFKCGDMQYPKIFRMKLDAIFEYHKKSMVLIVPEQSYMNDFMGAISFIKNCSAIKIQHAPIQEYDSVIWEGSQGLLLDQNIGFFPHVTRANTGTKNVMELLGEQCPKGVETIEYYVVTRAYQTRHGNGPMTNTEFPHNIKDNPYESNKYNERQGEFRRAILDLDLLKYGIERDNVLRNSIGKRLVITCLDQVENAYCFTHNDKTINMSTNETMFVNNICEVLGFDRGLLNRSPVADTMEKFEIDREI